jgi:hypothetical protein
MLGRAAALLAVAGSAAAFSPMMSMETGRRQVVQAGAAAAVAAPLLRGSPAAAQYDRSARAPIITIFDHRGCQRGGPNKEYAGSPSNSQDDEMCVKVASTVIKADTNRAAKQLQESISMKEKGIDGDYTACQAVSGGSTSCIKPGVDSGRGGPSYPKL